jgi:TIR domain/YEATS family
MTLRIEQDASYAGHDYWHWTVRLRGRQAELDRVAKVTWLLHESFSPSVVEADDRTTRFALSGSAWGSFELRARVLMRSGRSMQLEHQLELFYPVEAEATVPDLPSARPTAAQRSAPPSAPTPQSPPPRKLFLSYGTEDRARAAEVRRCAETLGAQVLDPRQMEAGLPWQRATAQMLRESDAVVGLLTSDFPSAWLADEMMQAARLRKPLLLLRADQVEPRSLGLPADAYRSAAADLDPEALVTALQGLLHPAGGPPPGDGA